MFLQPTTPFFKKIKITMNPFFFALFRFVFFVAIRYIVSVRCWSGACFRLPFRCLFLVSLHQRNPNIVGVLVLFDVVVLVAHKAFLQQQANKIASIQHSFGRVRAFIKVKKQPYKKPTITTPRANVKPLNIISTTAAMLTTICALANKHSIWLQHVLDDFFF